MNDDLRYADVDDIDGDDPRDDEQRLAVIKAAFAIQHQMVDKASALRLVLNRAYQDAVAAVANLIEVDPADAKSVRDLQWEVKRYEAMNSYISEVLRDGQEKVDELTAEQAERLSELNENMLKGEPVSDD